jgi:hypothetical protein
MANGYIDLDGTGSRLPTIAELKALSAMQAFASPNIYNLKPSNTLKARRALGRTDRPGRIAGIGDSTVRTVDSSGRSDLNLMGWPVFVPAMLKDRGVPASGDGWFGAGGIAVADIATNDSRWVRNAAWTVSVSGPGGAAWRATTTGNNVYTPKNPVSKFVIWYDRNPAYGHFTYTLDGGSPVDVNCAAANGLTSVTVDAVTLGAHSLTLTWASGGAVSIRAIDAYDDTGVVKPVRVCNFGISGNASAAMIGGDAVNSPWGAGYAMVNSFAPDLSILQTGVINDWRQSVALATSKANIRTQIENALLTGDAWMLTPSFDSSTAGNGPIQGQYVDQMWDLAQEYDIPLLDWRGSIISYAAAGNLIQDSVHPNTSGHYDIARLIVRALLS